MSSYKTVEISYGDDARKALAEGMQLVSRTVQCTLGPMGGSVALSYEKGPPRLTKDGVTVVKSCEFEDTMLNLGAKLLKRASHATNNFAGDGTTTSAILTNALV
jgi:chaperonin GroEL